jgi:hypothetical protein
MVHISAMTQVIIRFIVVFTSPSSQILDKDVLMHSWVKIKECKYLVGKREVKRLLGKPRFR